DADVAEATALGLPFSDGVGPGDLAPNSRYYLAMRKLMADENLGALALRCWPELPNRFGHWPYLAMSRLAEEGGIVALEGDVYGALTCLVGQMLGLGAGYISDWLEHDRHSILLWHPGHAAPGMVEAPQAQLGRHFNNNLPLVVNAPLRREHPLTLARIWACDGEVRIAVREARTVAPGRELSGVYGRVAIPDLDVHEWFCDLCQSGMPHHVTLLPGHHARLLDRAAQLLGLRVVG
ncbi:MAG: sugar isomerase, partial [Planctomycetota bacterium]